LVWKKSVCDLLQGKKRGMVKREQEKVTENFLSLMLFQSLSYQSIQQTKETFFETLCSKPHQYHEDHLHISPATSVRVLLEIYEYNY
jgi:hypothetical protein